MGYVSEEYVLDRIKSEGIDKIIFHVPMRPLHGISGLPVAYTTSSDELEVVPCKINTSRYDPFEKYKISMESMVPGYGTEHYYLMDFASMIGRGQISIRGDFKSKYIRKLKDEEIQLL